MDYREREFAPCPGTRSSTKLLFVFDASLHPMRPATLLLASMLVALACANANAQWKWRDASGRVTASDLAPPASVRDQDILARPTDTRRANPPASSTAAASAVIGSAPMPKSNSDPELDARRKRAADEQAGQQRQAEERHAAARVDNCNRARSNLAALNEGKRVSRANAQGELEVMDDKGRADEMQRARTMIANDCK